MELTTNPGGQRSLKGFCDHCGNITFQTIITVEESSAVGTPKIYTLTKCTISEGMALREHSKD